MVKRVTPYALNERVKEMRLKAFRQKLDRAWPTTQQQNRAKKAKFVATLLLGIAAYAVAKRLLHW